MHRILRKMFGPSCDPAHKKRAQSRVSHHWAFEVCAMLSDLTITKRLLNHTLTPHTCKLLMDISADQLTEPNQKELLLYN
jgi:hypothetical protein